MHLPTELIDVVPHGGVPEESVGVDEDMCLGGNVVAFELSGAWLCAG